MKKNNLLFSCILILTIIGFTSCYNDVLREPSGEDSVAPGPVSNVTVQNLPGGAKLTYNIPNDEDLLFVEATYNKGDEVIKKNSSVYDNNILLECLPAEVAIPISLAAIDRNNNRSSIVEVNATALVSPIDFLVQGMSLAQDFGGVRLSYNNEFNIQVEFQLFKKNSAGDFDYQFSSFIDNDKATSYSFRGFDPEPGTFGVVVIDRCNNISEMVVADITPLEEVELDIDNFAPIRPSIPTDMPDAFGWVIGNMWNGTNGGSGFHTSQADPGFVVAPYTETYHIVSLDLGVTANLSRMKFYQRTGSWIYAHGNPRYFEVWGTDVLPDNDGSTLDGWELLVKDGEVIKPSGAPLGTNSAEDVAAAQNGEEFEMANPNAEIRYIRFVNFESWSASKFMHIMELQFWGKVIE